jgi:hypothetical protein
MRPVYSMLLAVAAIAVLAAATPSRDFPTFDGCTVAQGPDEWLPGTAVTTLPAIGAAGTARVMNLRKTLAVKLPIGAAGTCYGTLDAATLTSIGARGFDYVPGEGWTTVDIGPGAPFNVVCTAQLVTPKGLKVFQCAGAR